MDYEKAYKEMMQRARELHKAGNALTKQQMEIVCPELAESEDERIRKEIRNFLIDMECKGDWIAYLEKLKGQPADAKSERVIKVARRVLNNWLDGTDCPDVSGDFAELEYAIREYDGEEKQKPTEKQDYSGLTDFERAIHRGFLCAGVENVPVEIIKETAQDCLAHIEQKPVIQDVDLNDAVYDYVRDHFIPGADFTPEYIKKLMENAFFAGVDYYLLKQESESCDPDTNVEKVIEDVIRVYGKTQGGWIGGYDIDMLIVNLRRAFNMKSQKPAERSEEDEIMIDNIEQFLSDPSLKKLAPNTKKQTLNWLKSLRPQPKQECSACPENIKGYINGRNDALREMSDFINSRETPPQAHWKPSEEQMEALWNTLHPDDPYYVDLSSLYNDLKKL